MRQVQLAKRVGETINYLFDFRSSLAAGETLTTLSATSRVESGVDAAPAAILSGLPANSAGVVTQAITAGVPGVLYSVTVNANTSLSQVLHTESIIAILPEPTTPGATAGEALSPQTFTATGVNEPGPEFDVLFNTDGTQSYTDPLFVSHALPNWFVPTTVGIGAGYYLRITQTSGIWSTSGLRYSGATLGVWNSLAGLTLIAVLCKTVGHFVGTLLIEISPFATGPATVSSTYTFDITATF